MYSYVHVKMRSKIWIVHIYLWKKVIHFRSRFYFCHTPMKTSQTIYTNIIYNIHHAVLVSNDGTYINHKNKSMDSAADCINNHIVNECDAAVIVGGRTSSTGSKPLSLFVCAHFHSPRRRRGLSIPIPRGHLKGGKLSLKCYVISFPRLPTQL